MGGGGRRGHKEGRVPTEPTDKAGAVAGARGGAAVHQACCTQMLTLRHIWRVDRGLTDWQLCWVGSVQFLPHLLPVCAATCWTLPPATSRVPPHPPPPPLKLKCKHAGSPMRFHYIICCPPPPLTAAHPRHHHEVWQQVGDFWQVALISWLGKKSAWQWRTCVRFRTSLNLSDPLICDAPTEKPSFYLRRGIWCLVNFVIWQSSRCFFLFCFW